MKKSILLLSALGLAALGTAWLIAAPEPQSAPDPALTTATTEPVANPSAPAPAQSSAPVEPSDNEKADAMAEVSVSLRDQFGRQIEQPKVQVRVLEKMINFLMRMYGEQWREHMEVMIRLTFPELAEALLQRFESLMTYNDWARDQKYVLAQMSDQERRQLMWDKRRELFGEDAELIWQGQLRTEQVQDTLEAINQNPDMPLDRKIDFYVNQLQEIYDADAPAIIENHRQEVMDHFLLVGAVQNDLQQMTESERRQHMRQLRKAVGLDDQALQRWDSLDADRDARWSKGKQYMQKRSELQASYEGAELDRRLRQLQTDIFGAEAEIIRNEEASGYLRYEGQQQFGLN